MVRRALRTAGEGEERAVRADEREVGLRVATVDGKDNRHRRHRLEREPVQQLLGELVLRDQRMREQRLLRGHRVAGDSGLGCQPLVGGDVLDEAEELGGERALRERRDPPASTRAGTSTTSSS